MLDDQQLLDWNHRGLIPGPKEGEAHFCHRVEVAFREAAKFHEEEGHTEHLLREAVAVVDECFGMAPSWVPVFFSNTGLAVWHGGGTLIEDIEGTSVVSIQLRRPLRKKKRFLGLYSREEFLAHELAHVGRFGFHEPKYEEFFAYKTSANWFRRAIGPIIQSSWEVWFFLATLLIPLFVDYMLLAFGTLALSVWGTILYLVPIGTLGLGLVRLIKRHWTLRRCLGKLKRLLRNEKRAWAVAFRLTDREIRRFARMSCEDITNYAKEAAPQELRWRLVYKAYFPQDVALSEKES